MMANLQVADVLEKALAAFGPNGEKWGQGTQTIASTDALCFNVAVYHVTHEGQGLIHCDAANRALREAGGFLDGRESMTWNDAPERIWPEVKAIYEKAIDAAKKKG